MVANPAHPKVAVWQHQGNHSKLKGPKNSGNKGINWNKLTPVQIGRPRMNNERQINRVNNDLRLLKNPPHSSETPAMMHSSVPN